MAQTPVLVTIARFHALSDQPDGAINFGFILYPSTFLLSQGSPGFLLPALGVIPVQSASFQSNSIEGWATLVNERLLAEDRAATERALELLRTQLKEVFPFNHTDLKRHDPGMEQLLAKLWGLKD